MKQTQKAAVSAKKADFNPQRSEVKRQRRGHEMVLWGALSSTGAVKDRPELSSKLHPNHAAKEGTMQTSYQINVHLSFIQRYSFTNRHPTQGLEHGISIRRE